MLISEFSQAFENTSTNVAASQMRNALNKLADGVTDPAEKKVSTFYTSPPNCVSAPIAEIWQHVDWPLAQQNHVFGAVDSRGFTSPERMLTHVVLRD